MTKTMDILEKLISIKSLSGQEDQIQKFIYGHIKDIGYKPSMVGENVVVKIKGTDSSCALIFNSHVDTVPAGDLHAWDSDPFKAKIIAGKIYGLGASDEKAAAATLLLLAKKFAKSKPACDVWLTFVVKEEIDGSGTRDFVDWFVKRNKTRHKQIAVILGEPTNLKVIEIAHKGNIFLKVTTHGDSGHGSKPEEIKKHAVAEMNNVSNKLFKLNKLWSKNYHDTLLGNPSIGLLTSIEAGNADTPNKFPDSCSATFDVRTTPKLHDLALSQIKTILKGFKVETVYAPVPCGYTDKNSAIVRIAKEIASAEVGISEGSNDMCFFTKANIPAIVFGPGNKDCIHKPNEYCEVSNISKCVELYEEIIQKFGNGGD